MSADSLIPIVDVVFTTDSRLHEATLEAANGHVIPDLEGEMQRHPWFEIVGVFADRIENPGIVGLEGQIWRTDVLVDAGGWLDISEVRGFHHEVDQLIDATRHTGATFVFPAPVSEVDLAAAEATLLGRHSTSTSRVGGADELVDRAEDRIEESDLWESVVRSGAEGQTVTVILEGPGGSVSDLGDFANDLAGPRKKQVVDVDFATTFEAADGVGGATAGP